MKRFNRLTFIFIFTALMLCGLGNVRANFASITDSIVVDNLDIDFGFTTIGTWEESGALNEYAGSSLWNQTVGSTATWTPILPHTGDYTVYVWYSVATNLRDSVAEYTIYHFGGTDTVVINQNDNPGTWDLLGTYNFLAGAGGKVVVTHDGGKATSADAVKWEFTDTTSTNLELDKVVARSGEQTGYENVYPNPASNMVTISNLQHINTIYLYNSVGQAIRTKDVNAESIEMDVNNLDGGLYFLRFESNNDESTFKKLIINK